MSDSEFEKLTFDVGTVDDEEYPIFVRMPELEAALSFEDAERLAGALEQVLDALYEAMDEIETPMPVKEPGLPN